MADDQEFPSPPTSVDVARRAGVSQSAVSLVFGGKATGRVGKQAQEAIMRAAHELGYQPNRIARTLRSGRSHLIVLAVPDVGNPFFAAVLQGAEQAARPYGYSVMLASVHDEQDWQQVILDALHSKAIDGCLLFTAPDLLHSQYAPLQGKAVLIDENSQALPTLLLDITAGAQKAMTHVLEQGHRRVAHLAADIDRETFALRHHGYLSALQARELPFRPDYYERTSFQLEAATAAAHKLLTCVEPPTAVFCDSDVLAVGVYKAASALGCRIPQDVSVVSFDDSFIAHVLEPALTTVAIPTTTIGQQAFLLLLALLEGQQQVAPSVTLPLDLVVRASTAPPVR